MQPGRLWKHLLASRAAVRRAFPDATLAAIEDAVRAGEQTHGGEIRFAVETDLGWRDLLHGKTPRQRAIEVFSLLRVWDTGHNNGVLIYLLFADRDVEIVVDRGLSARVDPAAWQEICAGMRARFARGEFEAGAVEGVSAASRLMATHFPALARADPDELPDRPVML
jgi:uncharacterized membrane protein YgcG